MENLLSKKNSMYVNRAICLVALFICCFGSAKSQFNKRCIVDSIFSDLEKEIDPGWQLERLSKFKIKISKRDSVYFSWFEHDLNPDYVYETYPKAYGKKKVEIIFDFKKGKERWSKEKIAEGKAYNDSLMKKMRRINRYIPRNRDSSVVRADFTLPPQVVERLKANLPFHNSETFSIFKTESLRTGLRYFYEFRKNTDGRSLNEWQFDSDREKLIKTCERIFLKHLEKK